MTTTDRKRRVLRGEPTLHTRRSLETETSR
jgi:hypothetical protein